VHFLRKCRSQWPTDLEFPHLVGRQVSPGESTFQDQFYRLNFHTRNPSSEYSMLEIVLTPSSRTVENVEASGGPETVTLDGALTDERMAFFISYALSILFPELRKIFICDLIVAALLSQAPLSACESQISIRLTETPCCWLISFCPNNYRTTVVATGVVLVVVDAL